MSKNATVGMIVKAAISVPDEHGEVAAKLLSWLAHDHAKAAEHHQQFLDLLAGRAQIVPMPLLKRLDLIRLPARTQPTDPTQAFADRPGLWVSPSFREHILPALKPVEAVPARSYHCDELSRPALDSVIQAELAKPFLGHWEDIISLIELHPEGAPGYFLMYLEGVNGEIFTVFFDWDAGSQVWYVYAWELDESGRWRAGRLVLSPANSQTL